MKLECDPIIPAIPFSDTALHWSLADVESDEPSPNIELGLGARLAGAAERLSLRDCTHPIASKPNRNFFLLYESTELILNEDCFTACSFGFRIGRYASSLLNQITYCRWYYCWGHTRWDSPFGRNRPIWYDVCIPHSPSVTCLPGSLWRGSYRNPSRYVRYTPYYKPLCRLSFGVILRTQPPDGQSLWWIWIMKSCWYPSSRFTQTLRRVLSLIFIMRCHLMQLG